MVFSSLTFLYFFLPLCIAAYFASKNRTYRNGVLLIFSLAFYSWGEPENILVMLLAATEAWLGGLCIARFDGKRLKKPVFVVTVVLLTANLAVFKYLNFAADTFESLTGVGLGLKEIALPIGISFYTFQILSYIIDLYRREIKVQKNPLKLLLYVALFPQLIAGPIVRYRDVEESITERHETFREGCGGLRLFILGLAKKVLIANNVARAAEMIYSSGDSAFGTLAYWVAALCYTMQIYYDFSGYSDMAIGLGQVFGFHFLKNFDYPYCAVSVTDFWRRWHISLSRWFRDYIYIPLGGSRAGKLKYIRNILIVWSLTGLWHGAGWNFVIWGLYFAALLLLERLVLDRVLKLLPRVVLWFYTFLAVNVSWVIFSRPDMEGVLHALKMMFVYTPTDIVGAVLADTTIITPLLWLPAAFVLAFPISGGVRKCPVWLKNIFCALLLVMCVIFILSSSYNPFIYFRF